MPRLRDLEAQFVRREERLEDGEPVTLRSGRKAVYHVQVETLAEADGIYFLCPLCFVANKGPVGTHMVLCWFTGKVPKEADPGPGRWNPSGTGYDDLTFVGPGSFSVLLFGGCKWHGFVRNGEATPS